MLNIGCHLSTAKGFLAMGRDALSIGANTFQFFRINFNKIILFFNH